MNLNENSLLKSLRDSNAGKDRVICDLIRDCIEKDMEIARLRKHVNFLEKWARWQKGK